MYRSIPKPPISPPPPLWANPGAFHSFEKFWSNLQRGLNPLPSRHVKATVQNFFPWVKPFIRMYIFCNKQLATVWIKICVNCNFNDNRVICYIKRQLKYPKSLNAIFYKYMNIYNVRDHSWHAAFCHAMHS